MAPPNEPTADHQKQNEDYHHINHNKNEPSHLPIHGDSNNTKMRHSSNSFSSNGAGTTGTRPYHQESDDTMDNTNNHLQTMQHNHTTMKQQHHHHHHHRPQMSASSAQPTPLFERLVTEEVQEIKAYARIIESQQRRLVELERVHGDLEARLELESNRRKQLESTLEAREREWANKFQELSKDRDNWKGVVQMEQTKNARLIDQVVRKDQDIHRMLQRKYDHETTRGLSVRNVRQQPASTSGDRGERTVTSASRSPETRPYYHKSPHEILAASGSAEKVRVRNVQSLLNDFFGL